MQEKFIKLGDENVYFYTGMSPSDEKQLFIDTSKIQEFLMDRKFWIANVILLYANFICNVVYSFNLS